MTTESASNSTRALKDCLNIIGLFMLGRFHIPTLAYSFIDRYSFSLNLPIKDLYSLE